MSNIAAINRGRSKATPHVVTSREFARDLKTAKRAAADGPVLITTRGRPTYTLMSFKEYQRLTGGGREQSLFDAMQGLPDTQGIEFEAPRLKIPE